MQPVFSYLAARVRVVAALIERDGLYLAGQRRKNDTHPLKWEFPGGKVEPGESPRQALERELREELGIDAQVGEEVVRYEYSYGGRPPIDLIFLRVAGYTGDPQSHAFESIAWVAAAELPTLDFLDGDRDFVRRLAAGEFKRLSS
ncbi:MAG: (deoxy)nucleoside triphosphate pyrophosphohydrolase [Bryobacteraceae bacterium]|nr:(deoxy)nucleoside triphosphate pyrophosphohydrolase [Bryobacteraceae bacterium]